MATDPVGDPIADEVRDILAAHPELRERFRQLEEQIATGTIRAHSHEGVARMLGFEDELEPGSVTPDGQPVGFWVPSDEPDALPDELRSAVFQRLSSMVRQQLQAGGASEEDVVADFAASRRTGRLC